MRVRPGLLTRILAISLATSFALICVAPYLDRLTHPSLYSDDILRIADLKNISLPRLLVRPFNEHLAPLFELVSWSAWQLAGRSLVAARWTYTLASLLPFLLCLIVFKRLLDRELGSKTAALIGVSAFGLSSLYAEVVFWYSASSFSWALLFTLGSLGFSSPRINDPMIGWRKWLAPAACSFLAPMFCGLGLLAGPLGSIQGLLSGKRTTMRNRLLGTILPLSGTIAYFLFGCLFRYPSTLSASLRENADFPLGLWHALRAPVVVLIPGLLGISNIEKDLVLADQVILTALVWLAALLWAIRSPRRSLVIGGLWLILGGYGLTYPLRVSKQSLDLLEYQRYHFFPQLGLAIVLACLFLPLLCRCDGKPIGRLLLATAVAASLFGLHHSALRSRSRLYRFPEQSRTFLAIEHLDSISRREAITRTQALAALPPIRTRWFPHDFNALTLLGPAARSAQVPDSHVRQRLLASLSTGEREALFGSMDVTPYVLPARATAESIASARPVHQRAIGEASVPGHYLSTGWPAYLEFDLSSPVGRSADQLLVFPDFGSSGPIEIWWTDGDSPWSELRSLRWRSQPSANPDDWAIPLDAVPHFDPASARKLRVYFRNPGPISLAPPRLVRRSGRDRAENRVGSGTTHAISAIEAAIAGSATHR